VFRVRAEESALLGCCAVGGVFGVFGCLVVEVVSCFCLKGEG